MPTGYRYYLSLTLIGACGATEWLHYCQSKLTSLNLSINNTYSLYIAMKLYTSHKSTIQRTPIRPSYFGHSLETRSLLWQVWRAVFTFIHWISDICNWFADVSNCIAYIQFNCRYLQIRRIGCISAIQLKISAIQLEISPNQFNE